MLNDDLMEICTALVVAFLLGIMGGWAWGYHNAKTEYRATAVRLHHAEYDSTTGKWQWLTNSLPEKIK